MLVDWPLQRPSYGASASVSLWGAVLRLCDRDEADGPLVAEAGVNLRPVRSNRGTRQANGCQCRPAVAASVGGMREDWLGGCKSRTAAGPPAPPRRAGPGNAADAEESQAERRRRGGREPACCPHPQTNNFHFLPGQCELSFCYLQPNDA